MSAGAAHDTPKLPGFIDLAKMMGQTHGKAGFTIPGMGLVIAFCIVQIVFTSFAPVQSALNWQFILMTGPLWMPIAFGRFAMLRFFQMRQTRYNYMNPFILLELRIPREIRKSPQAMEAVFSNMHLNPGEGTWLKKWWWGRTRPWWSFEIVSIGGEVHFYVYTRVGMRRIIESSFYAQYPEIEVIEAVDYCRLRDPSKPPYKMFACEYEHSKPDPFPIKTYVDYGIDKPGIKPEEQVDPFAQVLELMGSLGPSEQLWTQIIIRVSKGEKWRGKKNEDGKGYNWRDQAKEIVAELKKKTQSKAVYIDPKTGQLRESSYPDLTDVGKEVIKAIERNTGKPAYDVGIRSIYSAPEDKYQTMNPFIANIFKPYNTEILNSILPMTQWTEAFNDYPWEDVGGKKHKGAMTEATHLYRQRAYFHPPYRGNWMIMSAEELASIYHVPSSTVKTPGLPRTPSTTAAAPSNLPQ